jgi:hypothetical protein
MQVNTYWNSETGVPVAAGVDGVTWVEAVGPVGSSAVGGGGYATPYVSGQTYSAPSYPLVGMKPHPDWAHAWLVGFRVPYTGESLPVAKVRCYVVCLEDLPE